MKYENARMAFGLLLFAFGLGGVMLLLLSNLPGNQYEGLFGVLSDSSDSYYFPCLLSLAITVISVLGLAYTSIVIDRQESASPEDKDKQE